MAENLKIVSQLAMDLFYQEFRPGNAFLRLKHFQMLCISADAKLKQDEYLSQVNLNIRMRRINSQITLNADNYITVDVDIKNEKAILPTAIMTFNGIGAGFSVSQVRLDSSCSNVMPTTENERHQVGGIKHVVFWVPSCNGIEFIHLKDNCNPKKATVTYIPVLTEKSEVKESRKWAIVNMVTIFIKSAKEGVIIDMSNDGNPNVASQTEINKYLLKALQK